MSDKVEIKVGKKVEDASSVEASKVGHTKPVPPKSDVEGQYYYDGAFMCWNCGATNYAVLDTNYYMYSNCWYCGALNAA